MYMGRGDEYAPGEGLEIYMILFCIFKILFVKKCKKNVFQKISTFLFLKEYL